MSNTIFFVPFQSLLDEFMLRPADSYTYKFNFLIVKLTGYNTLFIRYTTAIEEGYLSPYSY